MVALQLLLTLMEATLALRGMSPARPIRCVLMRFRQVYALYNQSRVVLVVLGVLFVVEEVIMVFSLVESTRGLTFNGACSSGRTSVAGVYFGCLLPP